MKLSRRALVRAVAGAPLVLLTASVTGLSSLLGTKGVLSAQGTEPEPGATPAATPPEDSALGRLLAKEGEGPTPPGRRNVVKKVAQLESPRGEIRDFKGTNAVPPSGTFRALRTRRPLFC